MRAQIGGMSRHLGFGEMQRAAKRFVRRSDVPSRHERNVIDDVGRLRADRARPLRQRATKIGISDRSKFLKPTSAQGFSFNQLSVNNLGASLQRLFHSFHALFLSGRLRVASTVSGRVTSVEA